MGKKEKSATAVAEEFKTLIAMVPKLAAFLKTHNEIAAGYQKFRKNGGDAIPGVEKHLGIKIEKCTPAKKSKKAEKSAEAKAPKKGAAVQKVTTKEKAEPKA